MILFTQSLLFVHNPKTAGTSLLRFLSDSLPGEIHQAGVAELGTHHPHLAQAVEHAARVAGFGGRESRILAVARRPLDREQSMYLYFRKVLAVSPTLDIDLPDERMRHAVAKAAVLSFADWIRWQADTFGHCDLWQSQLYYSGPAGLVPDTLSILRFENLDADLASLMTGLGLDALPVPRLNITDRTDADLGLSSTEGGVIEASYRWMSELPDPSFVCGANPFRS